MGNLWLEVRERETKEDFTRGTAIGHLVDNFGIGFSSYFPAWLRDYSLGVEDVEGGSVDLSVTTKRCLQRHGVGIEGLFCHGLAVLHDSGYRQINAGDLRIEWPRIPIPGWSDGARPIQRRAGAHSDVLLDPDTPVPRVKQVPLCPEFAVTAIPASRDAHNMTNEDFALATGWGLRPSWRCHAWPGSRCGATSNAEGTRGHR